MNEATAALAGPRRLPLLETLRNRRFRLALLAVVGIPVLAGHLLAVFLPVLSGQFRPTDFGVYLDAARDLSRGLDPYAAFLGSSRADADLNLTYIYTPLLAWLLQPLTALPQGAAALLALVALQLCLLAAVAWLTVLAGARSAEAVAWALVAALAWLPVRLNLWACQVNLVLLLLSAAWLRGYLRGGGALSGAALGAGLALKFLQAPSLALLAWGRRWGALAAAALGASVLLLVAEPRLLPEYVLRVLPAVAGGSGFREDQSPAAFFERLLSPASFYGQVGKPAAAATVLGALVAVAVLAVSGWRLGRRPRTDRDGRLLEASLAVSAGPLLFSVVWPTHEVLLLLPMIAVAAVALRRRRPALLAVVAASWALTGPAHSAFATAIASGGVPEAVLRPWAELGLAGMLLLWVACLALLDRDARPSL